MLVTITLARKPLEGTVKESLEQYRTGALNMDGCRVGLSRRFPGNVILQHHRDCKFLGETRIHGSNSVFRNVDIGALKVSYTGALKGLKRTEAGDFGYADENGEEVVYHWDCVEGCPVRDQDTQGTRTEFTSRFFHQVQEEK